MRMEEAAFYDIFIYFYNKNILEYAQFARNGTETEIPYIESHSNKKTLWNFSIRLLMVD